MVRKTLFILIALGIWLAALGGVSHARTMIAVIDVARFYEDSQPAKAGEAHIQKVHAILQQGMDDLLDAYAGRENTPEAKQDLAQAYATLNRQMEAERQYVIDVLDALIRESAKEWRAKNTKYGAVVSSKIFFDYDVKRMDVTDAILKIFNAKTPEFAALPEITINAPEAVTSGAAANDAEIYDIEADGMETTVIETDGPEEPKD